MDKTVGRAFALLVANQVLILVFHMVPQILPRVSEALGVSPVWPIPPKTNKTNIKQTSKRN